ncbi:MAG: ISAs1 family transposase [Bacilli bacterium]|nr:ISAs1 family transposase [Bacilli bacterium]
MEYEKIKRLKEEIKKIEEPRRTRYGNIRHKLEDIIIIGLCTVICGGEDYTDMEGFGIERESFLRKFLELPNGIPDSDTFRRVFERLKPEEVSRCLIDWLEITRDKREVVAIDGKTICGSGNEQHKAYHVVSAFVAENQLTLGEITVDEKSNEITAVPQLLDLIDVEGCIVTADAISCQKTIVEKIMGNGADYTIGLKLNQPGLFNDVKDYFDMFEKESSTTKSIEKDHGRIETREYFLLSDISWLEQRVEWCGLKSVGMVKSHVFKKEGAHTDTRYFISSLTNINEFAYSVRKHWAIENQLHWCLDVIFREDSSRARKDFSPLNMHVLRKTSLSLLNQAKTGRISKKKLMFKAALNPDVLLKILFR